MPPFPLSRSAPLLILDSHPLSPLLSPISFFLPLGCFSAVSSALCLFFLLQPPTFLEIAQTWADSHSDPSTRSKTRDFVDAAFADVNNIVELMLCLIRGGDLPPSRASPASYRQPQVAELFARALAMGAPQPDEQSSLSLATYAMFKLAIDHGVKAGLGQEELHREVSEIVRQLPTPMLYKAMEAQYRAWSAKQSKEDAAG